MLTTSQSTAPMRRPACAQCGGTGFVYLWSIARGGTRAWFCDRPTCKRLWNDAPSSPLEVGNGTVADHDLRLVAKSDERLLQPV